MLWGQINSERETEWVGIIMHMNPTKGVGKGDVCVGALD